jgi:hypothetical protein
MEEKMFSLDLEYQTLKDDGVLNAGDSAAQ